MSLDKYCGACEAFPTMGYCGIAGCPLKPSMDFETAVERLGQWAVAYAADIEDDRVRGVVMADVERDYAIVRDEFDWRAAETEGVAYIEALPERGVRIPRLDLALGALVVAVKAEELGTAQAFAQTAVDFMTGNYEPLEEEAEYPEPFGNETKGSPP